MRWGSAGQIRICRQRQAGRRRDKCLAVANAMNELMSHEVVNVYVTEKAELLRRNDIVDHPPGSKCFLTF